MEPRDPFNVKPGQPPTTTQPVAASVVVVGCPACGRAVTVAAVLSGRNVACPVCSAPFVVPASESPIVATLAPQGEPVRFTCPTCKTSNVVPAQLAGQKVLCSKCSQKLLVPVPPRPAVQNHTILGTLEPPIDNVEIIEEPPRRRRRSRDRSSGDDAAASGTDYSTLSLQLGILSMFVCAPVLSPLAIIFGIVALSRGRQPGNDVSAIFGIILGIIGVLIFAFLFLVYFEQAAQRQGVRQF